MNGSICIYLSQAPYGRVQAAEAVRHLGGALNEGSDVFMLLTSDGVYLARDCQQDREGGWTALGPVLARHIAKGAPVLVHEPSARARGLLDGQPLVAGLILVNDAGVRKALDGACAVMTF